MKRRWRTLQITEADTLRGKLALIRHRGDEVADRKHQPGLRCIGTPIRDLSGRTFAAIRVAGSRLARQRLKRR